MLAALPGTTQAQARDQERSHREVAGGTCRSPTMSAGCSASIRRGLALSLFTLGSYTGFQDYALIIQQIRLQWKIISKDVRICLSCWTKGVVLTLFAAAHGIPGSLLLPEPSLLSPWPFLLHTPASRCWTPWRCSSHSWRAHDYGFSFALPRNDPQHRPVLWTPCLFNTSTSTLMCLKGSQTPPALNRICIFLLYSA